MKNKSKIMFLGMIALMFATSMFLTGCAGQDDDVIKIGVSLPLTGDMATIGGPMSAAIDLAIEDANLNSDKYKFVAIYEDDRFSPSEAMTGVQKLINVNNVDFLITAGSPVGVAIGSVAEENKIIHFGIASADVAGIGTYNFNHWTPPKKQAEKTVQEFKKLGINNTGIVVVNHEGGMAIRNALVEELNKEGIEILVEERFFPGERDFKTIWQKVENANPQIIFFMGLSPEFEVALKQRIELGFTIPLTTVESPKYSESPELFDGNWFVDSAETSPEFVVEFEERTGMKSFIFSGNSYDIVKIIAKTLEQFDEKPSSEDLVNYFLNLGYYEGAMGPMTMDNEGNLLTEAIILDVIDGKIVYR